MDTTPKKIVFAISDTGGGHRSAAGSLIAALQLGYDAECSIHDILRTTKFPGLKQAPEIYDYCSKKHLWLNNLFFRKTNSLSRMKTLTDLVYRQSRHLIERELRNAQPDAVVAVHPLVIGLLRRARDRFQASWPIITVVTDLVTIHASWATPGADIYLVPTQEARHALEKCKIPSSKIIDTGFPIHPKFALCDLDQQQARQQLSIDNNRFTILATGGGVGAGNMNDWINAMEKHCSNAQILVVTGNNKALFQELQKRRTHSLGLHAYGFVNNMETLMAASDVIVSKAGPGTIMEGVSMKRPLIITEAVGLQETGNIDYVKQNNLGYHCSNPVDACEIINTIASRPYDDSAYHNKAIVFDGAMRIAQIIFQHIDARNSEPQKDSKASLGA